jgi:porin
MMTGTVFAEPDPGQSGLTPTGTGASANLTDDQQPSSVLLGDMFGLRSALSPYGITIAIQETSEILGNVSGGTRKGADYDGLTQAAVQLDTQAAFGWHGGLFNFSALQIHGRNLSTDNLGSLQTASGIEADRANRLWELWYQQKFLADDRLDIKLGLQSADQEFIVTSNGAYFVNTAFGWPVGPSYDLPGGGPAYPLAAPAIRFRYRPIDPVAILVAVYNGSPAANNNGDAQQVNATGAQFPLNRGPLVLAELQYTSPTPGAAADPNQEEPLGYTYKIGAWYDGERFNDLRLDNTGLSLADPNSRGVPQRHHGNYSFYAVVDQMVWRDSSNASRSVSLFGRGMGTPQGDRNLVDYAFNGGVVYHTPFTGRANDTVGLGFGYAHVSHRAAAYDRDAAAYNLTVSPSNDLPIRSSETFIEATYQYQVTPWWQLDPDAQFVFKPGGSLQNPITPGQRVRNELVLGLRTNILF